MKTRENAPAGAAKATLTAGATANASAIAQRRAIQRRLALFIRVSMRSVDYLRAAFQRRRTAATLCSYHKTPKRTNVPLWMSKLTNITKTPKELEAQLASLKVGEMTANPRVKLLVPSA